MIWIEANEAAETLGIHCFRDSKVGGLRKQGTPSVVPK